MFVQTNLKNDPFTKDTSMFIVVSVNVPKTLSGDKVSAC